MVLSKQKIICLFTILGLGLAVCLSHLNFHDFKAGDLNSDGKIDILDLNLLQHLLLQKNSLAVVGDQNGDTRVDVIDLQILFNRLEKKWQEKKTGIPIDFLQTPKQTISKTFSRISPTKLFSTFIRDLEYKPSFSIPIAENKKHKIKTELQFLTGFLCHAPPVS